MSLQMSTGSKILTGHHKTWWTTFTKEIEKIKCFYGRWPLGMSTINQNNRKRLNKNMSSSSSTSHEFKIPRYKGEGPSSSVEMTAPTMKEIYSVSAVSGQEPDNSSVIILDTPDKSASDKKSYRIVSLQNGIIALLVSDPSPLENKDNEESKSDTETTSESSAASDHEESDDEDDERKEKLAACGLCVGVGSFSDPEDIQGLSHFLEHMIFMGSKKYPIENEYDQYIKKCAGFDNADTDFEETSFYFEISEEHLDGAIDRFTNLFIEPLMHKEAMTREREAVNSEFLSKKQDEEHRKLQLMASLVSDGHPSGFFSWGNLETLKDNISDEELYKKVHEFRRRHYSSHRMTACIQARYPLDTLQDFFVKYFSHIPHNGLSGVDLSHLATNWQNTFKPIWSEKLFLIKPIANVMKIEFTFLLESLVREYKGKPHSYIGFLAGHEGEGSLCHYLRKKLWIVDLVAGIDENGFGFNSFYTLFTVGIYLTQKGFQHIPEIITATFSYLQFLKEQGPKESIYEELKVIEANNFRFQTDQDAMDNVSDLMVNLKYYPPKDILTGPCLYFAYEPDKIQRVLNQINDFKMNILITSKIPINGNEFNLTEKWFGTEYCVIDYPKEWQEMWKDVKPFKEFCLPCSNEFVTTDFTLLLDKENNQTTSVYPEKIMENDICEVWYRPDDKFLMPTAYCYFYFVSPIARGCPKNVIMMTLYPQLVRFKLIEKLYPANVAGLEYFCYSGEKGFILKVSGFNQHLHRIIEVFTECMTTFANDITEEEFRMFVEQQMRHYYNSIIKPKSFAKTLRLNVLDRGLYLPQIKFELLKTLTLNDFKQFVCEFLTELKVQALFQGNLTADQSKRIMENVLETFKCQPIKDIKRLDLTANKLSKGDAYIRVKSMNPLDVNTITINFYQIGPISIQLNALIDLLMIITDEPLFENLRTQEQLGYDVSCLIRDNYGMLGYSITINSQENNHTAEHVNERIEVFRSDQIDHLKKMSSEDFEQFKESLIKIKSTDDNELKVEVNRNWAEITSDEYLFDRTKREIAMIRSITQEQLIEFYVYNYQENHRKLMVQVIGNKDAINGDKMDTSTDDGEDIFNHIFGDMEHVPLEKAASHSHITNVEEYRCKLEKCPILRTDITINNEDKNKMLS